jgi:thioredoxin-related protein
MGVIKLFVQGQCSKCPQAKEVGNSLKKEGFNVLEYDVETVEGLAEASFYSVQATPTFILEDQEENTVADFRGEVPAYEKIKQIMEQA